MSQFPPLTPAERAAVAGIADALDLGPIVADLPSPEAIDRAMAWRKTPEGMQAEVDRIARLEIRSVPAYLRGAL